VRRWVFISSFYLVVSDGIRSFSGQAANAASSTWTSPSSAAGSEPLGLVPSQIAVMVAGLLCSNHVLHCCIGLKKG
jgi:hypothetical protein